MHVGWKFGDLPQALHAFTHSHGLDGSHIVSYRASSRARYKARCNVGKILSCKWFRCIVVVGI